MEAASSPGPQWSIRGQAVRSRDFGSGIIVRADRAGSFTSRRLERLGVTPCPRRCYDAQYETGCAARFDVVIDLWVDSLSPAMSSLNLGGHKYSQAAASPAENTIASRIPRSTAYRQVIFRQRSKPTSWPRPGHSIACCCRILRVPQSATACRAYAPGPLQPAEPLPEYARSGLPSLCVRCDNGRQDRQRLEDFPPNGALLAGTARPGRGWAGGVMGQAGPPPEAPTGPTAISAFGDLKISRRFFQHFRSQC